MSNYRVFKGPKELLTSGVIEGLEETFDQYVFFVYDWAKSQNICAHMYKCLMNALLSENENDIVLWWSNALQYAYGIIPYNDIDNVWSKTHRENYLKDFNKRFSNKNKLDLDNI